MHVALGGPFLKPPANSGEIFIGSTTVEVDGEPMSFANVLALTCHDIGMPPPLRLSKTRTPKSQFLPSSMVIPIPSGRPVLVGGAPTISLSTVAKKVLIGSLFKRLGKSLGKATKRLGQSERFGRKMLGAGRYLNELVDKVFEKLGHSKGSQARNKASHLICTIMGHPVDVATGKELTRPRPRARPSCWRRSTSRCRARTGRRWCRSSA